MVTEYIIKEFLADQILLSFPKNLRSLYTAVIGIVVQNVVIRYQKQTGSFGLRNSKEIKSEIVETNAN